MGGSAALLAAVVGGSRNRINLPDGWEEKVDTTTGKTYYVDHKTQSTHWALPSGLDISNRDTTFEPSLTDYVDEKLHWLLGRHEWWLGILVVPAIVWSTLGFQPMLFTSFFGGIGLATFWVRRHPELLPKMPDFSYAKPKAKTKPEPIYRPPLVQAPPVQNHQKPKEVHDNTVMIILVVAGSVLLVGMMACVGLYAMKRKKREYR